VYRVDYDTISATDQTTEISWYISTQKQKIFSCTNCPDQLCCPNSLPCNV